MISWSLDLTSFTWDTIGGYCARTLHYPAFLSLFLQIKHKKQRTLQIVLVKLSKATRRENTTAAQPKNQPTSKRKIASASSLRYLFEHFYVYSSFPLFPRTRVFVFVLLIFSLFASFYTPEIERNIEEEKEEEKEQPFLTLKQYCWQCPASFSNGHCGKIYRHTATKQEQLYKCFISVKAKNDEEEKKEKEKTFATVFQSHTHTNGKERLRKKAS